MTRQDILQHVRAEIARIDDPELARQRDERSQEEFAAFALRGKLRRMIADPQTSESTRTEASAAFDLLSKHFPESL